MYTSSPLNNTHGTMFVLLVVMSAVTAITMGGSGYQSYSLDMMYHVDCSGRGLTTVPQTLPTNTTHLDISLNNFTSIISSQFSYMKQLIFVDITNSRIDYFSETAFDGLASLQELCLINNPGISSMDENVFRSCSRLKRLSISGYVSDARMFVGLDQLEYLALTTTSMNIPHELVQLPSLKYLTFVQCTFPQLTREMLQPLSGMPLTELTFHRCRIQSIENGTFDHFGSLVVLNFANNDFLRVDTIIDAMSTSVNLGRQNKKKL